MLPPVERRSHDLYRVLQVDPSANPLVIQAAYRVLAQIWHPDVSGDDDEMKRINAAWEVLGDPRRRKRYDIERAGRHPGAAAQPAAPAPAPPAPHAPANSAPGRSMFGSASSAPSASASSPSAPSAASARTEDRAGPPPGRPFGPVLRFGRYDGWSIGEISTVDRPYLEWLRDAPAGRGLRDGIDAVLATRKGPGAVDQRRHYETNERQAKVHTWAPGAPTKVG